MPIPNGFKFILTSDEEFGTITLPQANPGTIYAVQHAPIARIVKDKNEIPDWCPLEDYDESRSISYFEKQLLKMR